MDDYTGMPENGGYVLKLGTLQKRWKEWEEAKEAGQDPVFRIHQAKLTDSDWVRVFKYMDEHHGYNQDKIAEYFEREEGLKFHRTTLGMKLRDREAIERRVNLAANAAEGKGKAQLPHPKKSAGRRESSCARSTSSPSATPSAGPSRMPFLKTYSSRPSRKAKKGVSLKEPEVEDVPSRGLPAKHEALRRARRQLPQWDLTP
ncbi:hypothetical protein FA13DRAFT_252801 [Coprinellus micaceus]|uniref:Uncharacterized protein n=1 Tax=Coprinellus micaceus TaxID=71717 RepID=A0A4Y7TFX4_COPMI|nr:hypothetical protein FA13DRAFT_252801 [Coprinellus micaceus]